MKLTITNKDIIKLAAPISVALLIPQISFLTNTAFLGRMGEHELAVNGITGIFYLILAMVGYGLGSGIQIQLARRKGEDDKAGLAQIFTNGIMLGVLFSILLMLLCTFLAPVIFGYSLHDTSILRDGVSYLHIRVWGLPFLITTQVIYGFYVATNQSRILIYGALIATAINIFFDYGLIFGNLGFRAMGLNGAAVASVISEVAYMVTLSVIFFVRKQYKHYPVFNYLRFDMQLSQRVLGVSAPLIVQFLFSIGGWQIFFIFIEHLGNRALATSQILRSIFGIVGVGTWALATSCNTMVSNIIGQGGQELVPKLVAKIVKLSLLFAVISCILMLTFAREFLSLYRNDPALINYALPSLQVIVLATLVMSVSTVVFNGVVGTGNTLVNLTTEICCVCSYLVYCYFIIYKMQSPLYICWGAEFVYWTSLLIISFLYLRSGRWKGKVI